jgi:hypothetical protein
VIFATPMAVKVQEIDSWIHLSRVKHATEEFTSDQTQPENTNSCKQIDDLKLIFQKNQKTSA